MSLNFRRNYPIIILVVVVFALLVFTLGEQRVIAYTTSSNGDDTSTTKGYDFINDIDLFDDSVVHTIQVTMSDEDYETMISTYKETGIKDYFHADVIIDGVTIEDVGIRLKGNASLRTAVGGGMNPGGRDMGNFAGQKPGMDQLPQNQQDGQAQDFQGRPQQGQDFQAPDMNQQNQNNDRLPPDLGNQDNQQGDFQMPQNEGFQGNNSIGQANGEVKIPYMIKFNEFVSGQTYQGYTSLAIRTYGTSYNEALIPEPLTNFAANLVGLSATQTAFTGFKINDDEETLYVISELVNQVYLDENFDYSGGVLYKAEIGSTLNYKGDDPSSYAESFTQQTRVNDADLLPLISFTQFLEEADDETFEEELPKWLDVDSFALYLALNAMVVNNDSMIGMNNNYYLYYDDEIEQFTVLMWDTNESFGKIGGNANYDISLTDISTVVPGGRGGKGGGIGGGENLLISRFMDNATFTALYEQKLELVYETIFQNDVLTDQVNEYAELIHSVNDERNLVNLDSYDLAVDNFLAFISQRQAYLQSNPIIN